MTEEKTKSTYVAQWQVYGWRRLAFIDACVTYFPAWLLIAWLLTKAMNINSCNARMIAFLFGEASLLQVMLT